MTATESRVSAASTRAHGSVSSEFSAMSQVAAICALYASRAPTLVNPSAVANAVTLLHVLFCAGAMFPLLVPRAVRTAVAADAMSVVDAVDPAAEIAMGAMAGAVAAAVLPVRFDQQIRVAFLLMWTIAVVVVGTMAVILIRAVVLIRPVILVGPIAA